jgi:hypothetical protein
MVTHMLLTTSCQYLKQKVMCIINMCQLTDRLNYIETVYIPLHIRPSLHSHNTPATGRPPTQAYSPMH